MREREIISEHMNFVSEYIKKISKELDSENINKLINEIITTKRIFLMGAGRSGLEARAFAMRLMHLGFDVHMVGDVTTPIPTIEDLVIIISGSGKTQSIVDIGTAIKGKGPKMAIITTNKDYYLILDIVIVIPVRIEDIDKDHRECFIPMGTLFEVISHIFIDAIISELKYRTGTTEAEMKDRHMLSECVGML
jgi:6-phospho-3-hexuloisomerase